MPNDAPIAGSTRAPDRGVTPPGPRKIIHVDMDCFFAAIEMRDNPALRGVPMAVGGHPERRGVIATANYEARKFSVRSAVASSTAMRLCPRLQILPPDFRKYSAESVRIRAIFHRFTELVEPLSLDEAFLDVSAARACRGSATLMAEEIRRLIHEETRLTASAGVAPNKFLAKVASDWHKPNGLKVVAPWEIADFVRTLPARKIPGIGRVSAGRLAARGLRTCGDLQALSVEALRAMFGRWGERLYWLSRGVDERPVETTYERKSLSVETTFVSDLMDVEACRHEVGDLFAELLRRLEKETTPAPVKALFVKVKFSDFQTTTLESAQHKKPKREIYDVMIAQAAGRQPKPVRLLGVGVRFAVAQAAGRRPPQQLELWPGE